MRGNEKGPVFLMLSQDRCVHAKYRIVDASSLVYVECRYQKSVILAEASSQKWKWCVKTTVLSFTFFGHDRQYDSLDTRFSKMWGRLSYNHTFFLSKLTFVRTPQLEWQFWKTAAGTVGSSGRQFFIDVSLLGLPLGAPWKKNFNFKKKFNKKVMVWLPRGGAMDPMCMKCTPPVGAHLGAHWEPIVFGFAQWPSHGRPIVYTYHHPGPSLEQFRKVKNSSVSHFCYKKNVLGYFCAQVHGFQHFLRKSVIIAEASSHLWKWCVKTTVLSFTFFWHDRQYDSLDTRFSKMWGRLSYNHTLFLSKLTFVGMSQL